METQAPKKMTEKESWFGMLGAFTAGGFGMTDEDPFVRGMACIGIPLFLGLYAVARGLKKAGEAK